MASNSNNELMKNFSWSTAVEASESIVPTVFLET
jgi:hypothetical protein